MEVNDEDKARKGGRLCVGGAVRCGAPVLSFRSPPLLLSYYEYLYPYRRHSYLPTDLQLTNA